MSTMKPSTNATTDDGLQPTTTADSGGKAYKQF